MDRSIFESALSRALGEAMGGLVVWTTVFVFVATFAFLLWLFFRKSVRLQFHFHRGDPPGARSFPGAGATNAAARAAWLPAQELPRVHPESGKDDGRQRFLAGLDTAQGHLGTILIGMLYFALIAATVLMALLVFTYPDDGNRDFMLFYGGAVYLLAVLTLLAKIAGVRRRLEVRPDPGLREQLDALRSKIDIRVESEPEGTIVDEEALARARRHVAAGGSIDEACELVHPRYRELGEWARTAFRSAVEAALRS